MSLTPGSRLGPYEIVASLGSGGMGEVYRARDPRLGRDVAIKILPQEATVDAGRRRRFEQEARAVAALSHPNVLAIFDVGVSGTPFLVTELLEGETLRALLERGPLGTPRTIDLALQLAAGLGAAHARGIVHRDLKPENLFVTTEGRLKILDFGLARQISPLSDGGASTTEPATLPGTVLGTLAYMAPEQVRGLDVDHRADIHACGAVMFEMLTGRRAFGRDSPADTISAILNVRPSHLSFAADTAAALASIVRRCLEKDTGDRFQSSEALARALESASDSGSNHTVIAVDPKPTSIAVLPFTNLTAEADHEYFSDGLAEELVNALTRLGGLRVSSRTSSFRYRGHQLDVRQIGRELGVGAVLEGSVRRSGARLRITVLLTNVEDGYHIWSERYDREMTDMFDVQDDIVRSIVQAVAPALLSGVSDVVPRPTANMAAYDLYLRGRHFLNQRSPAVVGSAIRCFEQVIALDPEYALASAGLADSYSILHVYGLKPPAMTQPKALDAAARALELAPDLAEAHLAKALVTFHFDRHWRAARDHFLAALELDPRMAASEAFFGMFLATEYQYDEAQRHLDRALALEPQSSYVHFLAASVACLMGNAAATLRYVSRAVELQPEAPRWPETVGLLMAGRHDEAIAVSEQVVARTRAPMYVGVLAMIYARTGRLDDARRLTEELADRENRGEYVAPVAHLAASLGLADRPGVRTSLAACIDAGAAPFSVLAASRWLLDRYRGDEEFDRLLDRLHDGARPPR